MKKKRKKKGSKPKKISIKKRSGMLKEALADINREIAALSKKKQELKKAEIKRREEVSRLIKKEAILKSKKKEIEHKKESLTNRISKVQKIRFELSEI